MVADVEVHAHLLESLQRITVKHKGVHGFLISRDGGSAGRGPVVALTNCPSPDSNIVLSEARSCQQLLPGGFTICGVILVSGSSNVGEASTKAVAEKILSNTILEYLEVDPFIICHIREGEKPTSDSFYLLGDDLKVKKAQTKRVDGDIVEQSVVFQLKAHIPLTLILESRDKDWQHSVKCKIDRVCKNISSGICVYSVKNSPVLLSDSDVKGISEKSHCDSLYTFQEPDDGFKTRSKKKAVKGRGPIDVDLHFLVSGDLAFIDIPTCAPVVHHRMGDFKAVQLTLPVNVMTLISPETEIQYLSALLQQAVISQIEAMKDCLLQFKKDDCFYIPEAFHFQPHDLPCLVSVVYPRGISDDDLESKRQSLHELLLLPLDRPIFRRSNAYIFPGEKSPEGYLLNPHVGLPSFGVKGGKEYIVDGVYSYHHYMQDHFNDDKWGCAYRSLQTVVSWFRFQGYTERPVPSHREIQQALVDIGDKERSFVGSRKWIGSLEVSYCLDHLIGVTSKIMNVSSGADLAAKGRELAMHFQFQGSPIMIGGGVLAHTILGVNFDEVTGDIKFLILDPHYTGGEDLKVIQDKGWCGWKGPDFWDKNAHYNMCMPQRPHKM